MLGRRFSYVYAAVLAAGVVLAAPQVLLADQGGWMMSDDDSGWGMMGYGRGMPGGYGPGMGMMGGYGPGAGMGLGMMGGYGPGAGMGMMGGYGPGAGMGMGMMGGYGMGMGPMHMLDLSKEQRRKMNAISSELRKQHWQDMGKMMEQMDRLTELYDEDRPDPKAIGKAQADIDAIRRKMLESGVAARNRINDLLTDEQRQELQQWRHGGPAGGWRQRRDMMRER